VGLVESCGAIGRNRPKAYSRSLFIDYGIGDRLSAVVQWRGIQEDGIPPNILEGGWHPPK
jgi:hypothetical protein